MLGTRWRSRLEDRGTEVYDEAHDELCGCHGQMRLAVQSRIPVTMRTVRLVAPTMRQTRREERGSSMLSLASASRGRRSGSTQARLEVCMLVSWGLWLASWVWTAARRAPGSSGGEGGSERSERSEEKLARVRERRDGGRIWCVGLSEVIIRPPWPGDEGERRRCVRGGDDGAKVTGI